MSNFIDDFQEWVGETESPAAYFKYAATSLVAACLSSRCWILRQQGSQHLRIVPNLYTLLLGPSGNGKSLALSRALALLRRTNHANVINLYSGQMTAPSLYEMMYLKPQATNFAKAMMYVCNDELANDIGVGEYADQFIKSLTRLYLGEPFSHATVTRGIYEVKAPFCVNWIGCTTREWLGTCLSLEAVLGGFFARTVVIEAGYTDVIVVPGAPVPPGWEQLDAQMVNETDRLLRLSGEFTRTKEAHALELDWYQSRPRLREGDPMAPTQRREYDLLLKYEQIFSAADDDSLVVQLEHVQKAIRIVTETSRCIPELANFLQLPSKHRVHRELQHVMKDQGSMSKQALFALGLKRGLMAGDVGQLLSTWVEAGLVESDQGMVTWK